MIAHGLPSWDWLVALPIQQGWGKPADLYHPSISHGTNVDLLSLPDPGVGL
jgi:hypothetical protein